MNEGRFKSQSRFFEDERLQRRFAMIAKKYKPKEFAELCVANFVKTYKPLWIGNVTDDEANDVYKEWQARIQSLSYVISQDLLKIENNKDTLYQLYRRRIVSPETVVALSLKGAVNLARFGDGEVPASINVDSLKLIKYKSFLMNWNIMDSYMVV